MRILHIGLSSIMGGIESFALNYFAELRKYDIIFDFADIYGNGIVRQDEIEQMGGKVISFPNYKLHPCKTMNMLTEYFADSAYDCVHINIQTAANIIPVIAAKQAGIVPIIHSHVTGSSGLLRTILHGVNKSVLRKIPAVRLACGVDSGKWLWGHQDFQVVPNAIDLDKYIFDVDIRRKIRTEIEVDDETIVLGYVGRLEPVKNPLFTLEIVKRLKQRKLLKKVKLLVLGAGSLLEPMQQNVNEMGLTEEVCFLGVKTNVNEYLSAMDVFVMPSLHEGVSLAAVEAQTNGLPSFFSNTIPHEVQLLETSYFLELHEPDKWVDTIINMLPLDNSQCIERRVGVEGNPYNIAVAGKRLIRIYNECATRNGNR